MVSEIPVWDLTGQTKLPTDNLVYGIFYLSINVRKYKFVCIYLSGCVFSLSYFLFVCLSVFHTWSVRPFVCQLCLFSVCMCKAVNKRGVMKSSLLLLE